MGLFILIAGLIVALPAVGFQQSRENPDAKSFFQSDTHIVHDGSAD